jgi:hypothetical protein
VNKNSLVNIVLGIAVVVLYILHFNSVGPVEEVKEEIVAEEVVLADTISTTDTSSVEIKEAVASKVAYFNLEELVSTCSYLSLKTKALMNKERRLYESMGSKEREFQTWYQSKQLELAEYDKKKMLVQAHVDAAQRQGAEKQQQLQMEMEKAKQTLMEEKQRFGIERDKVIFEAMADLNKEAAWDYVLVDNSELRLVIPFNENNNVTKNLASIINKKYAK